MQTCFKWTVLVLCLLIVFAGGRNFRCDYKYIPAIQGWLKLHEMPSDWNEARLRCHMEGAVLASPLTHQMNQEMVAMAKSLKVNCALFTGIHSTFSRGDFASIEGVPLSAINHTWTSNEPDNYNGEENAIAILPDGKLADVNSKDSYPYFCYKKKVNLVITGCGTTDSEYNLDIRTGQCYKFHRVPRTWSRAYMNCVAEGAYLAIINSEDEATVLRELFAKNPAASIFGNFGKEIAFVGFHDWTEHGEWRTIHGQTLEEAGYNKFGQGEPNNNTGGEFCGSIFRNALLNDVLCEVKYVFICEKEPGSLACDQDCDEDD